MNANSNKDMKEVTVGSDVGSDEVQGGQSKYKVDDIVVKDEGLIDYAYDPDSDDNYWYKFGITNEEDIAFHKGMEPMYSRGAGRMLRAKKAGFKSFEFAKSEINNFKDESCAS